MKKLFALILAFAVLFSFTACKDELYPPVESTEEESRVLMTFKVGKDEYEVKYELYRALFLNYASEYDGGDRSFWSTAESENAKAKINERIVDMCADIFSVIYRAKSIGYDVYSADADTRVSELVSRSVNGYVDAENNFEGFGGDYDAYLAALKEMNLNYSVQDLLYRYSIATEEINKYYAGEKDETSFEPVSGAIEATADDVREFYYGDDSVRVLLVTLDSMSYTRTRAEEIRNKINSLGDESAVSSYIVGFTATAAEDAFDGAVIGKYSLDSAFYSEVTKSAFSLAVGEAGEVVEVNTGEASYYYILYRVEKNDEHLQKKNDSVREVYIANAIGELIAKDKEALLVSVQTTENYNDIKHSEISMK